MCCTKRQGGGRVRGGHYPGKVQTRQASDFLSKFDGSFARFETGAVHANVNLKQDANFYPGSHGGFGDLLCIFKVLYGDDHVRRTAQVSQPGDF